MTDEAPSPLDRMPVSILTGFLGSGKTTLLKALLAHPGMNRVAVIINEFGEIGLDHTLIEKVDEDAVLLNSGCLCCTVRGDLLDTLKSLYKRRAKGEIAPFDRIVIETTGLADPAPILHTMMSDGFLVTRFTLDGVIAVVDAVNAPWQLDQQFESVKQVAVADRIVLSKTDLAPAGAVSALEERLYAINPAAPVLKAVNGDIEPKALFDAGLYNPMTKSSDVQRWLKEEAYRDTEGHVYHREHEHGHGHGHGHHHHDHGHDHHGHDHHHHDVNRHDDHIRAFCLTFDEPFAWNAIAPALDMLVQSHGLNLLRMKGILNVKEVDQPVVVHAVQHLFHPPAKLDAWPDDDRRSKLVIIARDLEKEAVERILNSYLALEFA
ncbi:ATP-binding protein [Thalassobaculum fulvum]|uniref:ATP-binding protein n=1 Tax=Thalassobaculum fulvum TaxID=1633335 RepID=A0A918XS86_9PROT|nr:GTP-binding protein [Thalassobaculum fulvum]GHD51732.1 ATP-binding protein [Thalassobaculum fulvum]